MVEEKQKVLRLVAFWMFGTVMIVFAAITAYIFLAAKAMGGTSTGAAIRAGLPIWGVTALAAVIIYAAYYYFSTRQE